MGGIIYPKRNKYLLICAWRGLREGARSFRGAAPPPRPGEGDLGSTARVTALGTNLATFCGGGDGAAQPCPAAPAAPAPAPAPPRPPPHARSLPRGRRLRARLVPGLKKGSGDLWCARCRVFSCCVRKAESALGSFFVFEKRDDKLQNIRTKGKKIKEYIYTKRIYIHTHIYFLRVETINS